MQSPNSLAGQRVGYIRRQSGDRQDGNESTTRQLEEFPAWLKAQGAIPVPFDEGIVSGRDLAKRDTARRLLKLVRDGALDAIGSPDIDRLTRDEHGVDAGVIAEVLIEARALLVTYRRTYNLRDKDDLFQYKLDAGLAGREMQAIRDRMWAGVFTKATREAFFMGPAPLGYTTRIDEQPGAGPHGRTRIKRTPIRDEAQADTMAALGRALDECACLGDVVARLTEKGASPMVTIGKYKGATRRWTVARLRELLANPLYYGVWSPFRFSKRKSEVWDQSYEYGVRRDQSMELMCPDLAWFTQAQVEGWRAKMEPKNEQPKRRHRTYERPFRGMLCCMGCRRPMTAAGDRGYSCPARNGYDRDGCCDAPQTIKERAVLRVLRAELGAAIRARSDAEQVLRLQLEQTPELQTLREERDLLQLQIGQMIAQYYPVGRLVDVPNAIVVRMQSCDERLKVVTADISAREHVLATSQETTELVRAMVADPLPAFDRQPFGRQADILRLVFADVQIEALGWGAGRTYTLVNYTNLLTSTLLAGGDACVTLAYLSSLLAETER